MRGPLRPGVLIGGALGLGALGYAGALGWARRPASAKVSEPELEALIRDRLERSGACGQHLYLGTRWGRIHALETGRRGDWVLFLHGLGASAASYSQLLAELSHTHRVLAVDLPGAGLSDPVRFTGHPRAPWVDVISEVAAARSLGRFHLVGHSMGGLAAGAYAVERPDSVASLVMLAPVGLAESPPLTWLAASIPGLADLTAALDRGAMERQWARGEADVRGLPGGPVEVGPDPDGYRLQVSRRFAGGSDMNAFARLMGPLGFRPDSHLLPGLGVIAGRVTVVFGADDRKVEPAAAQAQLAHYPGIELRVIPGWGHLFPFLQPELTAEVLKVAFTKSPSSAGAA